MSLVRGTAQLLLGDKKLSEQVSEENKGISRASGEAMKCFWGGSHEQTIAIGCSLFVSGIQHV